VAHHEITTLAGQGATISRPNRPSTNRLLVLAHGGGLTFDYATNTDPVVVPFYAPLYEMIDYLCYRGYVVVSPAAYDASLGANQGAADGNDASTTQFAAAITAAQALPGISTGKYGLLSISAGAMTITNHVRRVGQTNLAGMLSFLPAVQMPAYRGTDAAGGADAINGVTSYNGINAAFAALATSLGKSTNDAFFTTNVYPVYNPQVIAATITVPWGFWTNSSDTLAPPAQSNVVAPLVPNGKGTRFDMGPGLMGESVPNANNSFCHNFSEIVGKEVHDFLDTWIWG
jgi:phage tail protein X